MHIVHIGPCALPLRHTRGGAIERRILELGAAQAAGGARVTAYSAEDRASVSSFRGMELNAIECRRSGLARRFEFLYQVMRNIAGQADVLHFHSIPEGAIVAGRARALKVLSYDHFLWPAAQHAAAHWVYQRALLHFDALLPVSEFCRAESMRFWAFPRDHARVFHNGVNLEQFHPDPQAGLQMRTQLGLARGPVILYVGRVCEQKGSDVLISAFRELKKRMPPLKLLVAGPAERFARCSGNALTEEIVRAGGIYLGAIEEADLSALYNACDIFVMPTRRDEMFGMAALEAQACGKPVICSRHGGLPEVISDESGRFFPVGDAPGLALRVFDLIQCAEKRMRLSQAAVANAQRFGWAVLAEQSACIYAELQRQVRSRILALV